MNLDYFERLKKLLHLKVVYRTGEYDNKRESTAEHVYGCMIIAQHFLKKVSKHLDELKVMKLILYHDIVEIETGDINILDEKARINKKEQEAKGAKLLASKIPDTISDEYLSFFKEYESGESDEAKFAQAIDCLEPVVHWALYTDDWTQYGFNEENVRQKKLPHLQDFPELVEFFNEVMAHLKQNNYF